MYAPGRKGVLTPKAFWYDALDAPSAAQMGRLRALMESRPILTRVPDQSLIVGDPGKKHTHVRATRDNEGAYAMVYTPLGLTVTVDLEKLSGRQVKAWWYNPRDGKAQEIGIHERKGTRQFKPPTQGDGSDWVLVLDDASRGFGVPGLTSTN